MSDYTVESPKKKKHYYQKNRNKNKGVKKKTEDQSAATEVSENTVTASEVPAGKAVKPQKAPPSNEPKAVGEEKEQKEQKKQQKSQKPAAKAQESQKSGKKNKKGNKENKDSKENKDNKEKTAEISITAPERESKKADGDFVSYFTSLDESRHEYTPDKNAEGFAKDPPFTDFATAYDPIADFMRDKEEKKAETDLDEAMQEQKTVIGIRFRTSSKTYYFDPMGVEYVDNSFAIVETARGVEFGFVVMGNREMPVSKMFLPLRPALRPASKADKEHYAENRKKEEEAVGLWNEKVKEHKLEMKLIDVEYTFDNTKLLFYFTSEGRVDFRELVKDLAAMFHCRIELRQMGIRDEAKVLGGLGVCGRAFCCGTFLHDFAQVSIKMAKEQSISLNSSKISGACGRLMCCLRYEHETYLEAIQRTPSVNWRVKTPVGTGVVVETKPLAGLIKVKLDSNPDAAPVVCTAEEAVVLGRDRTKEIESNDDENGEEITE